MRFKPSHFLRCVMVATAFFFAMTAPTRAEVKLPNGEWIERVEDLRVKVLGGYVVVERTWQAESQNKGEWRWHFNPAWTDLQLETEFVGPTQQLVSIRRAGAVFERTADDELVFVFDKLQLIRHVGEGLGWRWSDNKGNWITYDQAGKITAYGDRNDIRVSFTRDSEGRIHQLLDHHDAVVLTYAYAGSSITITDRAGRQVEYRYANGNMTEVEDVRGNVWKYGYSGGRMINKEDPERPGVKVEISYSGNRVVQTKDAQGFITQYEYDYNRIKRQHSVIECSPRCSEAGARRIGRLYDFEGKLIKREEGNRLVSQMLRDGPFVDIDINERNLRTVTERDANRNPTRIRYPDGAEVRMVYEPLFNYITERTDEAGTKTAFEYDAKGNLLRQIEAVATDVERITEFTYDTFGQRLTRTVKGATAAEDATTTWTYDAHGNVATETNAVGKTTGYDRYHVTGQPELVTNANSHTTEHEYLSDGLLEEIINPLGHRVRYEYDKVGNRTKFIDQLSNEMVFTYTANNWLKTRTDPGQSLAQMLYRDNPYGEKFKEIDPEGVETIYEYDGEGRLFQVVDGAENTTEYQYGDKLSGLGGLLVAIQYPTYREEYRYDQRDRRTHVIRVIPPSDGQPERRETTITSYDNVGRVQSITDPLNRITSNSYDELSRLVKTTDPAGGETIYGYDARDNLIAVSDANRHTHTFVHDKTNRLTRGARPLGQDIDYAYDDVGNLITRANAKGDVRAYTYDAADRRTLETHMPAGATQSSQSIVYDYDSRGLLTSYTQTGDTHSTATYTYNDKGEMTRETVTYGTGPTAFSKTLEYDYYANGLPKQLSYPDGTPIDYAYDDANRLSQISTPGGLINITGYQWQQPTRVELPGAIRTTAYDPLQRFKQITVQGLGTGNYAAPTGHIHLGLVYTYNDAGNITLKATPGGTYSYGYDVLDRLTRATPPESLQASVNNPGGLPVEGYSYDPVHNRIQSSHQPGTWNYNDNNELQGWGLGPDEVSYTYDANGHTLQETKNGQITDYVYNAAERLSEVKRNNATRATYQYDPMGRRIKKDAQGQVTWYQYSEQGLIAEYAQTGDLKRTYGWQPQGLWGTDPVFLADVTGSGSTIFWATHYFHNDHLGTPQRLTDERGDQTWAVIAEAFGKTTPDPSNAVDNPLRFAGQYHDPETESHYNYFRNYGPVIGRYTQSDPIGLEGGSNAYAYVFANPTRLIDVLGLAASCRVLARFPITPWLDRGDRRLISAEQWRLTDYKVAGPEEGGRGPLALLNALSQQLSCLWYRRLNFEQDRIKKYLKVEICRLDCPPYFYLQETTELEFKTDKYFDRDTEETHRLVGPHVRDYAGACNAMRPSSG